MNNLAFQIYGSTKSGIFQSTWKTDNAGVSSSTQIELPLLSVGTYNFWIDWGDGSTTNVTSYSQRTHTYASAGTYTLRATGTVGIWQFANVGDRLKILTVSSWGKLKLGANTFNGCSNLTLSGITDIPDLSTVTSLASAFLSCFKIVTIGRVNEWNTSSVTNMSNMFSLCSLFNDNIGSWDTSAVTNTSSMFAYTGAFNQPLSNWERTGSTMANVTNMSSMFAGNTGKFNQDISNWNVSGVTNFDSMFFAATLFNNGSDANTNLITGRTGIDGWNINTASFVNMGNMFSGAGGDSYVTFNRPIGNWNTSKVNNMSSMFSKSGNGNHAFNQYIGDWDTSSVTNMSYMFRAGQGDGTTSNFNQDISKWNVSKVTDFSYMLSAKQFTNGNNLNINPITGLQGIDGWDINTISSVNMSSMFYRASAFNQNIGSWNMTKVISTNSMFRSSTFNQPLNNWERIGSTLGNVTDMGDMFASNIVFNQDIGNWNTSSVTTMLEMFYQATAFNQNIGSWNVSNVTNFASFMSLKTPATFSSTNLDAIYNGWSALPSLKPNLTNVNFGTAKYTSAAAAGRLKLTSPVASGGYNWGITDGGQLP